jgi:ABC-type transport system involved in cytochrome c biogenesis permease component
MSFLPIVDRELRLAARRKGTFRIRSFAASIAIALGFFSAPFVWIGSGGRSSSGETLFSILAGYTFLLCSMAGVFLTAGSLVEEKRDGTLGLLFLTNLKGYDVVLGKFIGQAVNPLYALLALIPVTGLPLLLGGVTGAEFWRTTLASANALFVSLAIGIFVSSVSRDPRSALVSAFSCVIILFYIVPALPRIAGGTYWLAVFGVAGWISPGPAFVRAMESGYRAAPMGFWFTLLSSHVLGWALVGIASATISRSWQDGVGGRWRGLIRGWFTDSDSRRSRKGIRKVELLSKNPIFWICSTRSGNRRAIWIFVLASGALFVGQIRLSQPINVMQVYYLARACGFVLKILIAIEVCRFFVEHRRSGALELLFSTPLRNKEIINGQILSMRRLFLMPTVTFLALAFMPLVYNRAKAIYGSPFHSVWNEVLSFGVEGAMMLWFAFGLVVDICTVVWVGMWLALSMKNSNMAPAMTILAVLILPSLGTFCCLDLLADVFLLIWAITNLKQDMRWIVARQTQQGRR